jgi:hypothetical protein
MIGQIVLINGAETALLTAQPNWESEVSILLELPTDVARQPITLKESRRNFAQSARYTMGWKAYLPTTKDAEELRIFLTRIRGEPVAVPIWPDQCSLNVDVTHGSTILPLYDLPVRWGTVWIIANSDFSLWEIVSVAGINFTTGVMTLAIGTHLTWTAATASLYPVMIGRLTDRPKPESITDEALEVDLKVKETSAFLYRLSPQSGTLSTVGANIPTFRTTPLFTSVPNFAKPLDWTELPDVIYETVGFQREEQQRVYDHRNVRGLELEFYQTNRNHIGSVESFWRAVMGPVLPFMIPTWRGDMRMRADTPVAGHPLKINIEDSEFCDPGREAQPGDPFVALIDNTNIIDPRQLTQTSGIPGSMSIQSSTNMSAHSYATTILSRLLLARFKDTKLEWSYTTPYLATARIQFVDLPPEYAAPPSALPQPAYLFIFTEVGVRVNRFTSYENTIQIATGAYAGTYTTAPFSFETLKTGLKLDQEKLDFKSFKFPGNPLNRLWPFALEGILTLDVIEVHAANPKSETAIWRFHGDVISVDSDYKASAIAFGNFFDRKVPRFLLSVSDNYVQFSPPTHLSAGAFLITGTIPTVDPTHTSQVITVNSAAAHAQVTDYFAGGWLEIGTGSSTERRGIYHSEPASGTLVTLHIDRPILKGTNGAAVNLFPGYDGSIDQCDTKFNNRINFGGHPYIPNINPTVKAMKPKTVQGGKK